MAHSIRLVLFAVVEGDSFHGWEWVLLPLRDWDWLDSAQALLRSHLTLFCSSVIALVIGWDQTSAWVVRSCQTFQNYTDFLFFMLYKKVWKSDGSLWTGTGQDFFLEKEQDWDFGGGGWNREFTPVSSTAKHWVGVAHGSAMRNNHSTSLTESCSFAQPACLHSWLQ